MRSVAFLPMIERDRSGRETEELFRSRCFFYFPSVTALPFHLGFLYAQSLLFGLDPEGLAQKCLEAAMGGILLGALDADGDGVHVSHAKSHDGK